jgi:two-component system NtrC family sensor kinase
VASLLEKLPTILVLAVLVGMFIALRKHSSSGRIRLWMVAWALIFAHFFVQAFETTATSVFQNVLGAIDLGALELSGVVFVVSLTTVAEDRVRRLILLGLLAAPAAFHVLAISFDWHIRWILAGALALLFFGGAAFSLLLRGKPGLFRVSVAAVLVGTGIWAIYHQLRGSPDEAVNAILTLSFGLCGLLFWRRFPRFSPGVLTVAGGFLAWGAVFPVGAFMDRYHPNLHLNPELWNVPKFFVAFGMILTLIEDKSRIILQAGAREHAENALLQRFARITSRLLAGSHPAKLCGEIAIAITDTSHFRRAAIFLTGEDGALSLAGSSGFSAAQQPQLEERARWTAATIRDLCAGGTLLGNNSFLLRPPFEARGTPPDSADAVPEQGEEVLVPMVSSRGAHLGCLLLSGARDAGHAHAAEIAKLEMFAADFAVTLENTRLHHQLVRSEKLAALGQLVAGVAHELNNPLTGIIGYSDLLSEGVGDKQGTLQRIGKLGHEARRMKRIVDGLLRFARQSNSEARISSLETALRDAVQLHEYHLRRRDIEIQLQIEPLLPELAVGEDELKQVLLNLLNNAVDAVEESSRKSVRIHAGRRGDRLFVRFDDSGPGFADLNRAFDPFYTTKPVGKGTGLGLSICYGIAQKFGGEIHLSNRHPSGASVLVEFPIAQQPVPAVPA